MRRLLLLFFLMLVMPLASFSQKAKGKKNTAQKQVPQQAKAVQNPKPVAVIETTMGTIEIEFFEADAPKTAANFIGLAEQGYYNGIKFHRVSKGFVIQGGDSTGTGSGGRSIYGGFFVDELDPAAPSYKEGYKRGVVAMANRGPNTNTSQFFIILADADWLPHNYTIFGRVIKGMDVVDAIGSVEIIPSRMGPTDGKPKQDIIMKSVMIERR